jgi:hypothetical protein
VLVLSFSIHNNSVVEKIATVELAIDTDKIETPIPLNNRLKLANAIAFHTKVPKIVYDKKVRGAVFIFFKLSEHGAISITKTDPVFMNEKKELVDFECKECEKEALRVLNILPKDLLFGVETNEADTSRVIGFEFPTKKYK